VIELVPETYVAPLDLTVIFGRVAPLHVDLGCGDGSFLSELARHYPEENFLGIDRLVGRVARACRRAAALENVRVLNVESSYAVRHLLTEGSVETFYLLFPDPWPKRRHWRHRIVTEDFLGAISQALVGNGTFRIATDDPDYFERIKETARANPHFAVVESADADPFGCRSGRVLPLTKFERTFRAQDVPIHWLELRKVSPVR